MKRNIFITRFSGSGKTAVGEEVARRLGWRFVDAHALEAVTGYTALLHPEAVSIGMMGAGYLSNRLGMLADDELERQRALLESYGLPLSYPAMDVEAVTETMQSDKKVRDGVIHWVLLEGIGNGVSRSDVPAELAQSSLRQLVR